MRENVGKGVFRSFFLTKKTTASILVLIIQTRFKIEQKKTFNGPSAPRNITRQKAIRAFLISKTKN